MEPVFKTELERYFIFTIKDKCGGQTAIKLEIIKRLFSSNELVYQPGFMVLYLLQLKIEQFVSLLFI